MNWIDLHSDTPLALYQKNTSINENELHVDLKKSAHLNLFLQCAALYCPCDIENSEGLSFVADTYRYFEKEIAAHSDRAMIVKNTEDLDALRSSTKRGFLMTAEDLRYADTQFSFLKVFQKCHIKIATPLWRGVTSLGGAYDTDEGLTDFGAEVIEALLDHQILPDISHASRKSAKRIAEIIKTRRLPLVATHSNAFAVFPHPRNLTDEEIRMIAESGGVIGVNFYSPFLTSKMNATLNDIFLHLRHIIKKGGLEVASIGSDFDGIDALPKGIKSLADAQKLPELMSKNNFTSAEIEHIFHKNANKIIKTIL